MLRIYIFRVCKSESTAEHPLKNAGAPLAYFQKKAEGESGERRELTLLEGALLSYAIDNENAGTKSIGLLEKDEFGKLRFTKNGENDREIEFSFSHSGELLVLAISDSGAVGIDVEENKSECSPGVEERFLSGFYPEYTDLNPEIYEVFFDGDGLSSEPVFGATLSDSSPEFFRRWTAMEALVKMQGEGISAYKRAREIMAGAELFAFTREDGKRSYTVTLAHKKQSDEIKNI